MNRLKTIVLMSFIAMALTAAAQQTNPLTIEDLAGWKRITGKNISDDGKWITVTMEPWRGDATVRAYNRQGEEIAAFEPAKRSELSASHYLLITKTTPLEEMDMLKLKKTKAENMPMDQLIIYNMQDKKEEIIDSLASYQLSGSADRLAYQRGRNKDSILYVRSLDDSQTVSFRMVSQYFFSKENDVLYFVSKDTTALTPGLYVYRSEKASIPQKIFDGKGIFKQIAPDEKGRNIAFLYCDDSQKTDVDFALYLSENNQQAKKIAERTADFISEGWVISENGKIYFSKQSKRLFFGIAPEAKQKDTTQLAENRPDVHIWNWDEEIQYTVQDYNRTSDLKKTYVVTYNLESKKKFIPLTSPQMNTLHTVVNDNVTIALLTTSKPYGTESMWEGFSREDVYAIDLLTGQSKPVRVGLHGRAQLSPNGKYVYWYSPQDSAWFTWSVANGKEYRLDVPADFVAWNGNHDTPSHPPAYGAAGWSENDEYLLLYDRFDVWRFSPTAISVPVNLTKNGREKKIAYRYVSLDREGTCIDLKKPQLLTGFNHTTKGYGYYEINFSNPAEPSALIAGNYMLSSPTKAKKTNDVIYTVETFSVYPDVHLSDLTFKQSKQLTGGISQQDDFLWGTAELTSWISLDGKLLEGVIYKPANFDPSKKYPLIVNFYERNSDTYHAYRMPEPNRSTVDYHFYNSNGYIVFNPDIIYEDGYPGESCFNAVMSGVTMLITKGYINEKAIGTQGHSWGGYQDAYLATRTRLFAAIESGAPVVNMFSAYGGIRWGSGLNRSFQYEHGQSRIGKSIWESPLRYLENSPLFDLDKVQTPILIMHNDKDGHVPWYQGIEFFIALKRLKKPAWLLNYTGEPHWPTRMANKIDFQKRMFQFFEHYLNNKPMPRWMREGVPATDRDVDLGY